MNRRRIWIVLVLGAVVVACGCADAGRQVAIKGPGKDLARQWAKAAGQPADIEDAKPEPEPKLLPMTHFSAGNLFEKQGSYAQAIEQYRKAVELNTAFAAAHGRLGLCYTKTGQYDLAVQSLKRATNLQPTSGQLWNNLGFAYLAQKNYARAEECFGRALQAKPGYTRARLNMAITLVQVKRDAEALGHLLAVMPEPLAQYNLGTMQLAANRPVEARSSFEKALSLHADFPAASKGLSESLARLAQLPASPPVPPAAEPDGSAAAVTPRVVPAGPPPDVSPVAAQVGSAPPVAPPAEKAEQASSFPVVAQEQARAAPATRPIVGVDDEPVIVRGDADTGSPGPAAGDNPLPEILTFPLPGDCLANVLPAAPAEAEVPAADPLASSGAPGLVSQALTTFASPLWDVPTFRLPDSCPPYAEPPVHADDAVCAADASGVAVGPRQPDALAQDDPSDEAAILRAIVCHVTSRSATTPTPAAVPAATVADFDLVSLRWAVWTEGMECLHVDVTALTNNELQAVLAKWLCAVNELDSVTSMAFDVTAYADDM